jgi:TRAP-type C4-dicarboxylate transport system permease small subunit
MRGGLARILDRLVRALGFLGQLVLLFMVVTICYDVVMRYVFLAPTTWSLEINTFLIVFLAVIPAAEVLRADAQLRIGFLADRLPLAVRRALHALMCVLGVGFCAVMVWKSGLMSLQAVQYGERMSTTLGTPMAIPYLFLPVGFGVLGLAFLGSLWQPVATEGAGADPRQQL